MSTFNIPQRVNEPIKNYIKGSAERSEVEETYHSMFNSKIDIPLFIGNDKILTSKRQNISPPHEIKKIVGTFSLSQPDQIEKAIESCLNVKESWTNTPWEE